MTNSEHSESGIHPPAVLTETPTGRLTVREVFPPRRALARGRGAMAFGLGTLAVCGLFAFVKRNRSHVFDLKVTRSLQRVDATWFDRLMHGVMAGISTTVASHTTRAQPYWLALGFPIEAVFQLLAWEPAASRPRSSAPCSALARHQSTCASSRLVLAARPSRAATS